MKKLLIKLAVALVILLVVAGVAVTLLLDSIIHKGVTTVGPQLTKTDLQLGGVKISLLSGKGELNGFVLGNPEGYKADSSIEVRRASLALMPGSVFSDKVVIRSIQVISPEITLEGGASENNLTKILENIQSVAGGTDDPDAASKGEEPGEGGEEPGSTKIQVDEFILRDAKVKYAIPGLGGQTINVTLPSVELKDLGQGEEGITVAELAQEVFEALTQSTGKAVTETLANSGKAVTDTIKGATGITGDQVDEAAKAIKGLGGLLKKKDGE